MAKVFFHSGRSNIGSFRLKNFSLHDWNAMVLYLVGKLNFFEFQEECLPIIELNLDQVHAYSINIQSHFSREQSFVWKNFILYFSFGFFHVESPPSRLHHQLHDTLYIYNVIFAIRVVLKSRSASTVRILGVLQVIEIHFAQLTSVSNLAACSTYCGERYRRTNDASAK